MVATEESRDEKITMNKKIADANKNVIAATVVASFTKGAGILWLLFSIVLAICSLYCFGKGLWPANMRHLVETSGVGFWMLSCIMFTVNQICNVYIAAITETEE